MLRASSGQPAVSPSDPPKRTLELAAGLASYTDEGEGRAIVAVHGLPGSARDFRWLAPHITTRARFIRVEQPGFGGTPIATEPDPSPIGRARFVLAVCRAIGLDRPLILGHSMGGVVACAAIDLAPDAFRGLALLSSPGLEPHRMLRRLPASSMSALLNRRVLGPALAPVVRRLFRSGGFSGYSDDELYRTIHCVARTSISEHAGRVHYLSLPTLVAWCEDDPLIEPDIAESLAEACPDGPRLRFPKGGHNPQKTHAAEIADVLLDWLKRLP